MLDVLQVLIQLLNINCSATKCYYSNPFEGLFYVIFLPSILLIAFLYLLMNNLRIGHKGIKLLVVIAAFIFIVLQGWFTFLISFSYLWILIVILLGIWWAIRGRKEKDGGTGGSMPGSISGFMGKAIKEITPEGDLYIYKAADGYIEGIKGLAGEANRLIDDIKATNNHAAKAEYQKTLTNNLKNLKDTIQVLDDYDKEHPFLKRKNRKYNPKIYWGWHTSLSAGRRVNVN